MLQHSDLEPAERSQTVNGYLERVNQQLQQPIKGDASTHALYSIAVLGGFIALTFVLANVQHNHQICSHGTATRSGFKIHGDLYTLFRTRLP